VTKLTLTTTTKTAEVTGCQAEVQTPKVRLMK